MLLWVDCGCGSTCGVTLYKLSRMFEYNAFERTVEVKYNPTDGFIAERCHFLG